MQKFPALWAPPPDPRVSGGWGLCPQTPSLRRLGARPQTPIGLRRLGAPPLDPPNSPPLRISGYAPACRALSCRPLIRGAGGRTWARGQLKYDGFPVLWSPIQTEKMPQFGPKYDVISLKKKVFNEILTIFPVEFRCSPKKRSSRIHGPRVHCSPCPLSLGGPAPDVYQEVN